MPAGEGRVNLHEAVAGRATKRRLFQSVRAGFRALTVLFAGGAGNADRAHDFAVHDDGNAALDRYGAFHLEDAQAYSTTGERILKRLCGPLELGSRAGFGDAELRAAQ